MKFQSRDWVDVYSGKVRIGLDSMAFQFQSRDWVDVYSGTYADLKRDEMAVSIPRLG